MCTGEDLDDSNTLRSGRVFYLKVACENIRFASLFSAGDVSRETSPAEKREEEQMFSQANLKAKKTISVFKNTRIRLGPLNTSLRV